MLYVITSSNANPPDTNPITYYKTIATIGSAYRETKDVTQLLIIRALELLVLARDDDKQERRAL